MSRIGDEERRRRIGVRHRLAPGARASTVRETAASMVALHATDPAGVFLEARARMPADARDAGRCRHRAGGGDREWYLGPRRAALFDGAGNAGPTIWAGGGIVGGWAPRPSGAIAVRLLENIDAETVGMTDAEAARLAAWLGRPGSCGRSRQHDAGRRRAVSASSGWSPGDTRSRA